MSAIANDFQMLLTAKKSKLYITVESPNWHFIIFLAQLFCSSVDSSRKKNQAEEAI